MKGSANKRAVILALFILVVLAIVLLVKNDLSRQKICIENKACFNAEIADTNEKKVLGLRNRDSLEENSGMLFVFEEKGIYGFWMKGMRFPIDIIWINPEMKISGIVKDFQPCKSNELCPVVYPDEEIAYALEVNSGLADKNSFEDGDSVYFE